MNPYDKVKDMRHELITIAREAIRKHIESDEFRRKYNLAQVNVLTKARTPPSFMIRIKFEGERDSDWISITAHKTLGELLHATRSKY